MNLSLPTKELIEYIADQLVKFFPDKKNIPKDEIAKYIDLIVDRTGYCFSKVDNQYFRKKDDVIFNHLNADQYAMFLYFVYNTLYKNNVDPTLCTKLFLLNKYLHGIDVYYEVELPDIFLFVHPMGTVLGRAEYADYFIVYQNCGVGSNHDVYPTFQKYVSLHPGSMVLGNCVIEENCKISAGSIIINRDLEKNSIYIGNTINHIIKKTFKKPTIWR
jgi:serine O-acetyltransferase